MGYLVTTPAKSNQKNRRLFGMKKCKKNCLICIYVQEGKEVKSKRIEAVVSFETKNIVYMLICKKDNCQTKEGNIHRSIGES